MKRTYALHQCNFLPWVGFWQKVCSVDVFDVRIYESYNKRSWQDYTFIGEAGERSKWGQKWGLPVQSHFRHGQNRFLIENIRIERQFTDALLTKFRDNHQHDKYFHQIYPILENWLTIVGGFEYMWQINFNLLILVKDFLGIDTDIVLTMKNGDTSEDFARNAVRFGCDAYLSGPHGREYLNEDIFARHCVDILYQDTRELITEHPQSVVSVLSRHGMAYTLELVRAIKIQ